MTTVQVNSAFKTYMQNPNIESIDSFKSSSFSKYDFITQSQVIKSEEVI